MISGLLCLKQTASICFPAWARGGHGDSYRAPTHLDPRVAKQRRSWGIHPIFEDLLESTPKARFFVEEQFSDGMDRAVVRWRYDWGQGHVRGVDIVRVRMPRAWPT